MFRKSGNILSQKRHSKESKELEILMKISLLRNCAYVWETGTKVFPLEFLSRASARICLSREQEIIYRDTRSVHVLKRKTMIILVIKCIFSSNFIFQENLLWM